MHCRLIKRGNKVFLRHWEGSDASGCWVEVEVSASNDNIRIEKARLATKVALELTRHWSEEFDSYDTAYQIVIGQLSWLVIVTMGTGFSHQDGELWYSLDSELTTGLGNVQLGEITWKPIKLPLAS